MKSRIDKLEKIATNAQSEVADLKTQVELEFRVDFDNAVARIDKLEQFRVEVSELKILDEFKPL